MSSRRTFLQQSAGSLGALLVTPSYFLSRTANRTTSGTLPLGLFFDEADLVRMRTTYETNTAFHSLRNRLSTFDRSDLRSFIRDDVRYNDQLFDIVKLSDGATAMAFLYLLTGDADAADLAAESVREILKFDRWDYFLEDGHLVVGIQRASSTLTAVALCSDWLGDSITNEERSHWLEVMKEKGCESCFRSIHGMRHPETVIGWTRDPSSTYFEHRPEDIPIDLSQRHIILDSTNLKAVPAAALAIGAVAYQAHFGESDDTKRWIEQAVFSTRSFGEFFVSDGSYHEGVSYANYTAQNILKATSVFKRHNIEDLTDLINWPGYADYAVGMAMPIHSDPYEIVNFGDNGNAKTGTAGKPKRIPKRTAVALWIAANFRDAKAQWFGLNLGGEHDEWALIWYDSEVEVHPEPDGNQLWHSDLDWIVARTGFRSDDLTVAMRSGGPGNHEHADRNSIIVKNFGEHLVTDPYRPPYSFKDPNWMMRTTAGHSAVLVDGHGHQYHDGTEGTNPSDAVARIVRKEERRGYCYWTSDATPAYSMVDADIKSITRSVFVLYEYRAVIVFDMLNKEVNESTLKARYFGYNHDDALVLTTEGNSFTTHRPRAVLLGSSSSPNGVVVSAERLPIPEENASKHPFAEVATKDPSLNPHLLTVLSTSRTAAALPMVSIEYDDETYIVRLKDNDRTAELRVHATGYIPEFDLR